MNNNGLIDLANSDQQALTKQCEVCVVGAGAAGIYLAVELAKRGLDVILLEAGNKACTDASTIGFETHFDADLYPGATLGRFFGLGGSTSHWGGALVPHTAHDLRDTTAIDDQAWQQIVQTVADKSTIVLNKLGWKTGPDFSTFATNQLKVSATTFDGAGFEVTSGLLLPFRKKNLIYLLQSSSVKHSRLQVIVNAVVNDWHCVTDQRGLHVKLVKAVAPNGKCLTVTALRFIITAGAIESARILLELDQSAAQPLLRKSSATGCYLSDHLSMSIADVSPESIGATIKLFAPRFSHGWMRGFRFLEKEPPIEAPRAFAHFIFDNQNPGFALAKEGLCALQGRRWPKLSVMDVAKGLGGLTRLGYQQLVHSTLYIPCLSPTHLQLDIEQTPLRENRITLSGQLDRYGRRTASIHWRIGEVDIININSTAKRLLDKWSSGKSKLPSLIPRQNDCNTKKPHDAYHPVGTCRMGNHSEAVVDNDLKVWGLENIWVVSTGVLPNAGTANPTFTMLCLAERLVKQISNN
jgi:choline dehydrogenase-like flavoprotein